MSISKEICGRCVWCVYQSNLYLQKNKAVKPTHICDEKDFYGRLWFIEEGENEKTKTTKTD